MGKTIINANVLKFGGQVKTISKVIDRFVKFVLKIWDILYFFFWVQIIENQPNLQFSRHWWMLDIVTNNILHDVTLVFVIYIWSIHQLLQTKNLLCRLSHLFLFYFFFFPPLLLSASRIRICLYVKKGTIFKIQIKRGNKSLL